MSYFRGRASTEATAMFVSLESQSTAHLVNLHYKVPGHTAKATPELTTYNTKLGWVQGVLIPCLLNIWGVMLFLRISWVVAQAGIGLTIAIIALSSVVCVITTLSLSALCTNGVIEGGGVYYLVSRSLGAELGASVGIVFAFANAVAASMNIIGFCESLNDLFKKNGLKIIDNGANDTRIIGMLALIILCLICAIGMNWETKVQSVLLAIIILAILNYIFGTLIGPSNKGVFVQGFVGFNSQIVAMNWKPDFRPTNGEDHDFFSVFAIYFPAVTGVQAGANICGDLKDPAKAIPKGTLIALGISVTSYLVIALLCGSAALRDAGGDTANQTTIHTLGECKPSCKYGLHNNYEIMQIMSWWGPLVYAGCWAATLSTALTNLLAVPRLIQAVGKDRIYPGLFFFSKPYGRHGEPYRGYVLSFFVSLFFLMIGDLNEIAPLITNFYLASYALINFCTFHANLVHHISWRPTFRFHNKWVSLLGFTLCSTIMVMVIGWIMTFVTVFIFLFLYLTVRYRKLEVNWGSSTDACLYQDTVTLLLQMTHQPEAVKSYNPQVLVLSGQPHQRPALLSIAHLISKIGSFMIVADIDETELTIEEWELRYDEGQSILRQYRAFYVILDGYNFEHGVRALLRTTGLGRLSPNIMLIGYKNDWSLSEHDSIRTYVRVIQLAFERKLAVAVYRDSDNHPAKCSRTTSADTSRKDTANNDKIHSQIRAAMNPDSNLDLTKAYRRKFIDEDDSLTEADDIHPMATSARSSPVIGVSSARHTLIQDVGQKVLDVWWLYDDGGLIVLLSYIISQRGCTEKLPMRIFALGKISMPIEESQEEMKALLAKFRIEYTSLTMLRGINRKPQEDTKNFFEERIKNFKAMDGTNSDTLISEKELIRLTPKTSRYLRLREMLLHHSSGSSLIFMTLPLPRKGGVPAALYVAWLEVLSQNLPPVLFVRGSSTSVLDT